MNHWVRYGLPFVSFCVLGTYGLSVMIDNRIRREDEGRNVKVSNKYEQGREVRVQRSENQLCVVALLRNCALFLFAAFRACVRALALSIYGWLPDTSLSSVRNSIWKPSWPRCKRRLI